MQETEPKIARRKRVPDRLETLPAVSDKIFVAEDWAEDFGTMLNKVSTRFDKLPRSDLNDRRRAVHTLKVAMYHLNLHPDLTRKPWFDPLAHLAVSLEALDNGRVLPMLAPVAGLGSGAPQTDHDVEFRAFVLLCQQLLCDVGYGPIAADREVAQILTKLGHRGRKSKAAFPASSITNWRADHAKLPDDHPEVDLGHTFWLLFRKIPDQMKLERRPKEFILPIIEREILDTPHISRCHPPTAPRSR